MALIINLFSKQLGMCTYTSKCLAPMKGICTILAAHILHMSFKLSTMEVKFTFITEENLWQ